MTAAADPAAPGRLTVRGLRREFPGATALDGVDLDLPGGEFVALVGPSGCGKTTLLRIVAGLDRPDAGSVHVDGRDLGPLPAADRPTAMVFQSDTLFADQTVAQNVAFGLRMRRATPTALGDAVDVALLRMQITGLRDRYPEELSGGQRRRVALARAMVVRPAVLLLDEPLAGLEATLRARLLHHLRATQRRFATTTVYVTHDIGEALGTADRVVLLRAGRVVQVAAPRELYTRPGSAFAARAGGPASLLTVPVLGPATGTGPAAGPGAADGARGARVRVFGADAEVPAAPGVGRSALLVLRPHEILLRPPPPAAAPHAEARGAVGLVTETRYAGAHTDHVVETEQGMVTAAVPAGPGAREWRPGAAVRVALHPGAGWLLSAAEPDL